MFPLCCYDYFSDRAHLRGLILCEMYAVVPGCDMDIWHVKWN